ncbi:TA system VapC family ribonuclease toxin [Luteitalea sp.]|uniref:TA system VapC family ribonuclease toxin n=1 Tax=Luteitalea sp. TaxID=2004800 RepID=UPI0025BA6040|nr:TA system VapC family ribonuclease toxin [Luteitalea sp.]
MTPSLLDVNVLLALTWPSHQHHQAAHQWFRRESRHGWATCALTQLAFVRLSANPSYSPDFVTPQEAATLLVRLTAHARHRFWNDLPGLDASTLQHAQGHQQVMDAYLVQLARHSRGRVVTFDARLAAHATGDHEVTTIRA